METLTIANGSLGPSGLQAFSLFCFFLLFLRPPLSPSVGALSLKTIRNWFLPSSEVKHSTHQEYFRTYKESVSVIVLESVSLKLWTNWCYVFFFKVFAVVLLLSIKAVREGGDLLVQQPNPSHTPLTDNRGGTEEPISATFLINLFYVLLHWQFGIRLSKQHSSAKVLKMANVYQIFPTN